MRSRFSNEAQGELTDAAAFYRGRGGAVLAGRFRTAVRAAAKRLSRDPTSWEVIDDRGPFRRCPVGKPWPYDLIFSVEADAVLLVAVWHHHRDPGELEERLRG